MNAPAEARTLASIIGKSADILVGVLDMGDLDEDSRRTLAPLSRELMTLAAVLTRTVIRGEGEDEEARYYRTYAHHVGSISELHELRQRARDALTGARLVWLDEIEAMTDAELLRIPGIGKKTLATIREALDAYYWRSGEPVSRELWERLRDRLDKWLHWQYLPDNDRVRILHGIAFAEQVLDRAGMAEPSAPRMIA